MLVENNTEDQLDNVLNADTLQQGDLAAFFKSMSETSYINRVNNNGNNDGKEIDDDKVDSPSTLNLRQIIRLVQNHQ